MANTFFIWHPKFHLACVSFLRLLAMAEQLKYLSYYNKSLSSDQ